MFKKTKKADDALTTSEAPETAVRFSQVPLFPGHFHAPDVPVRAVTLMGGGPLDGTYVVADPVPQELSHGSAIYNLSDRAAGVYAYRVR